MLNFSPFRRLSPMEINQRASVLDRQALINTFNRVVIGAKPAMVNLQHAFIADQLTWEETLAYERYCRFMINAIQRGIL